MAVSNYYGRVTNSSVFLCSVFRRPEDYKVSKSELDPAIPCKRANSVI